MRFSQAAFCEIGGVKKLAQSNYETNKRQPDAGYLAAIAAAGADVLYILTGQRSQPVRVADTLPPRQRALINNYESTDEEGRRHLEYTALLAAESSLPNKSRRKAA